MVEIAPALWSSIFVHANALGCHKEAMDAIIMNPDLERQKVCSWKGISIWACQYVRQFVCCLGP